MKNTLSIIVFLCIAAHVNAQPPAGKVIYKETVKFDLNIQGEYAQIAAQLPKEHSISKELYFSQEASLYKNEDKPERDIPGDNGMKIVVSNSEVKTYNDLANNQTISQKEFMGRTFLVKDDIPKLAWKITEDQKNILGYACRKATLEKDTMQITAWFAQQIPVPAGPDDWTGLPGLILQVEVGKNHSIVAQSVAMGNIDNSILKKPSEGKKVSRKQYDSIVQEKTKEMQEQYGGKGSNMIIRINH